MADDIVWDDEKKGSNGIVWDKTPNNAKDAVDPGIGSKLLDATIGTGVGLGKQALALPALAYKGITSLAHPLDALGDLKVSLGNELDRASKDSEDYYKQGDPIRGTLAAIPFLGGSQKSLENAIPISPTKNVDYEKVGEEGIAPIVGAVAGPKIASKIGEGTSSVGRSLYSKAFPKNVDPETLDLLIKEGISGTKDNMVSQIEGKTMDQTQKMADLENSAPDDLTVDLGPTEKSLINRMRANVVGASSSAPTVDKALRAKLDQIQGAYAGRRQTVNVPPPATPPQPIPGNSPQLEMTKAVAPRWNGLADQPLDPNTVDAEILSRTTDIPSTRIPFRDALNLKRGAEYEGSVAGAFQGKGPLRPGQLAANMVVGGLKKGIGEVYPEYNDVTEHLGDLIDAKKAAESARSPSLGLPYRLTPQALLAYLGYHMGGVPGGLTGAVAGGLGSMLGRTPYALTKGGMGAMDLGSLLQNPASRQAILGSILAQQGQGDNGR